jgi:hypothetical protein
VPRTAARWGPIGHRPRGPAHRRGPRVQLAIGYRARTVETDVGGDFYDVFAAGDSWVFVTGDVVGKGAKAAAITGLVRHTLRAEAQYERSPAEMLRVLNRAMLEEFTDDEQGCGARARTAQRWLSQLSYWPSSIFGGPGQPACRARSTRAFREGDR